MIEYIIFIVIWVLTVIYFCSASSKREQKDQDKYNELAKEYSAFKQKKWDEMWEYKSNQKRDLELVLKRECDILFDRGESFGISSEELYGMIIENLSHTKIETISDIYAADFKKVAKIALYSHVGCLTVFQGCEEDYLYRYDLNGNRIELTEAESSKMFKYDFDDLLESIPLCDVLEAYKQGVTVGYDESEEDDITED
jgi:hypothetical protein